MGKPNPNFSQTAKNAREAAKRIRDRINELSPEQRQQVNDCVVVLRNFVNLGGDAAVIALSLIYHELSMACAISMAIKNSSEAPPQTPANG